MSTVIILEILYQPLFSWRFYTNRYFFVEILYLPLFTPCSAHHNRYDYGINVFQDGPK